MDEQQVISDWLIVVEETIFVLQGWLGQLELWQACGRAEPDDFAEACQLLREAGLWGWARQVGDHGLAGLARAVEVEEMWQTGCLYERSRW